MLFLGLLKRFFNFFETFGKCYRNVFIMKIKKQYPVPLINIWKGLKGLKMIKCLVFWAKGYTMKLIPVNHFYLHNNKKHYRKNININAILI